MRARALDPRRLDIEVFARERRELDGETPLPEFERVCDSTHADARPSAADTVRWQLGGRLIPRTGGEPELWLDLRAQAEVSLVCQRCLGPVDAPLAVERSFRFVQGEEAAAALDAEVEDDVLALSRAYDVLELVEDELLLAMPLVPRHEHCPEPLPQSAGEEAADDAEAEAPAPHPFAALSAWKRRPEDS